MKKFILISILGTLSMIGKGQIVVNTSGDTSYIITNGQTDDDLKITGEGPYTAGGNSGNPDPNWYLHGYNISNGIKFVNANIIDTNGKYNNGILLNNKSSITNSGIININGQSSIGVLSADGTANIINDSNGVINIKNNGIGIATKGYSGPSFTGNIQNDGLISGTNGGTGIFTYGSQYSNGGTVTNNGAIKINGGTNSTGVSITGYTKFENNGEISGSSTTNMASNALVSGSNGAQIHNGVTGTIIGKNYSSGIYSQNNNTVNKNLVINDGVVNVEKGYGIYSLSSDIVNNGTVTSNGTGIYLTKYSNGTLISTLINNGTIVVNQGGTGIVVMQSSAENKGLIQISGNNTTGVLIQGGGSYEGTFINNRDLNVDAGKTGVTLIKLQGSTTVGQKTANLDNKADLTVLGDNSTAIYSTNAGKISNIGTITVNNGVGIKLEYSSLLEGDNKGKIIINGSGIGILVGASYYNGSTLINDVEIDLQSNGTGIYVSSGTTYLAGSTGENKGTINFNGDGGTGIYVTDTKSSFKNNADLVSDKNYTTGIAVTKLGSTSNAKEITLTGDNSVGIDISNDGVLTANTGIITINNGIGIRIKDSVMSAGQNTGIINVEDKNGVGISGSTSNITNNGIIYVNGLGLGIYVNDSNIENYGVIDITKGTGIAVENNSQLTNGAFLNITEEGTGILSVNSNLVNESTGNIAVKKGTNLDSINSSAKNYGILTNEDGTGISGSNSIVENHGEINIMNGTGIAIKSSSQLTNTVSLNVTGDGIGISSADSSVLNDSAGNITLKKGINISSINSVLRNNGVLTNENGTGISGSNSIVENHGEINIMNGTGIAIESSSQLTNTISLNVIGDGIGISSVDSSVLNDSAGNIKLKKGINISSINSVLRNNGVLTNENGTGIYGDNSNIENYGNIEVASGDGIVIENNSFLVNTGTLNTGEAGINTTNSTIHNVGNINSKNGITSNNSEVLNDGVITSIETGLYALNNVKTVNTGEITGKIGVMIDSGIQEYSGHFLNSGKISGSDYAIKFNNGDNVLELASGTEISGKIKGSSSENTLIINGDVKLDEASNFSKLVSSGNSKVEGTINLNPSLNNYYYTEAFGTKKDLDNVSGDTSLGELTVNGTINIGVNYENINNETDKTGKIVAQSLKLQNGKVVLTNGGATSEDIVTESGLTNYGDQIRVKSIIISSKQQAVNPDFEFQVSDGMKEKFGWSRETVSRIENGVTVLDELYTNNTVPIIEPIPEPTPELRPTPTPEPSPSSKNKVNSIPRNRVDLDTVNRLDSITERFLQMETKDMNVGERKQSVEYIGTKAGSNFNADNKYNYDYDVDSDGIAGTTLHKHTENLYSGFILGYTSNNVDYSNADTEKVESFNINAFGRYEKNGWDLDSHVGYGYNRHTLEADWLGAGELESNYDSHVLKTGLSLAYNQELGNTGISLHPNVGMDYILESEGTIETNGMSDIGSASETGFVGKMGVNIGNTSGKIRWNAGITYMQNFTDTFHKEREMSNEYIMEELHYGKEKISANFDIDYKVTDKFTLKAGYEYEKNSNYENQKINTGISYILGERE